MPELTLYPSQESINSATDPQHWLLIYLGGYNWWMFVVEVGDEERTFSSWAALAIPENISKNVLKLFLRDIFWFFQYLGLHVLSTLHHCTSERHLEDFGPLFGAFSQASREKFHFNRWLLHKVITCRSYQDGQGRKWHFCVKKRLKALHDLKFRILKF